MALGTSLGYLCGVPVELEECEGRRQEGHDKEKCEHVGSLDEGIVLGDREARERKSHDAGGQHARLPDLEAVDARVDIDRIRAENDDKQQRNLNEY